MIDKKGEKYFGIYACFPYFIHKGGVVFMFMHICFVLQIGEKEFDVFYLHTFAYMFMSVIAYLFVYVLCMNAIYAKTQICIYKLKIFLPLFVNHQQRG